MNKRKKARKKMEQWERRRTSTIRWGLLTWIFKRTNAKKVPAIVIQNWHCDHTQALTKCKLKCTACGSSCVVKNFTRPGQVVCCDAEMGLV